jgi:protein-S-isoprenylcysteine O-methyltransferase Ste14
MIALHVILPIRQVIPGVFRLFGLIPLAFGLAVVLWAAGIFDRAGTAIKPFQESTVLVQRGPFLVSRNPMYLSMVCALLGVAVLAGSVSPFLVVPAFAILIDRRFIRAEEAILERRFGAEYVAYKARVRRWL